MEDVSWHSAGWISARQNPGDDTEVERQGLARRVTLAQF